MVTIKDVFMEAQSRSFSKTFIDELKEIYSNSDHSDFTSQYFKLLRYPLTHNVRSEPSVTRLLKLTSVFALKLNESYAPENLQKNLDEDSDEDEVIIHPFLTDLLYFLLRVSQSSYFISRLNAICLIGSIFKGLTELPNDEMLLEELYAMAASRLKDTSAAVRAETVHAIGALQDPSNENCPVIQDLLFLMCRDPHYVTRRNAAEAIAIVPKTLDIFKERLRDVNVAVRKTVLNRMSEKISVRCFSLTQRAQILDVSFNDPHLVPILTKKLLPFWLKHCGNDIFAFLGLWDIQSSSQEAQKALNALFEATDDIKNFVSSLELDSDSHLMPRDKLTPNSALFWRCLCQYIKSGNSEVYLELFDEVTPTITVMCDFLTNFIEEMEQGYDQEDFSQLLFIFQQLLLIVSELDFSDTYGTNKLRNLLLGTLKSRICLLDTVEPLVNCLYSIHSNPTNFLNHVVSLSMDICKPFLAEETEKKKAEEANDILALQKGLRVTSSGLKRYMLDGITPGLVEFKESVILPCIHHDDISVRQDAVETLALYCLQDDFDARECYPFFMQAINCDEEEVQIVALKGAFDILMTHGPALVVGLSPENDDDDNVDDATPENEDLFAVFHEQLMPMLDSESEDLRTIAAEGMGKLILWGRVTSPQLLSRLMILCFNPAYDSDYKLKQYLTSFLPTYVACEFFNPECLVQSFEITMDVLFAAPSTNVLSKINVLTVGAAFFHLASLVKSECDNNEDSVIHDGIAVKICNLILQKPRSKRVGSLAKMLGHVELSSSYPAEIPSLLEDILKNVRDKNALKAVKKFQTKLHAIKHKDSELGDISNSIRSSRQETEDSQPVSSFPDTPYSNTLQDDLPTSSELRSEPTINDYTGTEDITLTNKSRTSCGDDLPKETIIPESPPFETANTSKPNGMS